jgi:hypothetical protein
MTFPSGFEALFGLLIIAGLAGLLWLVIFTAVRAGRRR